MDSIFGICQALGIGIAIGALCGAPGASGGRGRSALIAAAFVLGVVGGGISASSDDISTAGGAIAGAAGALLACAVVSDVVAGAGRRGAGGAGGIGLMVVLAALVIAGLSILLGPLALIALAGLLWLAIARRRRSERKYEGLRVLR
jgi:hypothetical protein